MQVGDIFWDNEAGQSLVITFEKYDMFWGLWETGQSFSCWTATNFNDKIYLGKSKATIDNLFKTENEDERKI